MLKFFKKFFGWGTKSISVSQSKKVSQYLQTTKKYDNKHQIIELDKIYHTILKELWYQWSFWEILKKQPKEIKNIQQIWDLHKLRNSLVHELKDFDEKLLENKSQEYRNIIEKFLKQVTKN